jgi:hypothetical protein
MEGAGLLEGLMWYAGRQQSQLVVSCEVVAAAAAAAATVVVDLGAGDHFHATCLYYNAAATDGDVGSRCNDGKMLRV